MSSSLVKLYEQHARECSPRVSMSERQRGSVCRALDSAALRSSKQHELAAAFASCVSGWNIVQGRDARSVQAAEDGTSARNISLIISFFIAAAKLCPTSSAIPKSPDIALSASALMACEVSGTSVATSLPRYRIIIANLAKGAVSTAV